MAHESRGKRTEDSLRYCREVAGRIGVLGQNGSTPRHQGVHCRGTRERKATVSFASCKVRRITKTFERVAVSTTITPQHDMRTRGPNAAAGADGGRRARRRSGRVATRHAAAGCGGGRDTLSWTLAADEATSSAHDERHRGQSRSLGTAQIEMARGRRGPGCRSRSMLQSEATVSAAAVIWFTMAGLCQKAAGDAVAGGRQSWVASSLLHPIP